MSSPKDEKRDISIRLENSALIRSFLSGSASSLITTIVYQPLEVIKTNLQLREQDGSRRYKVRGRSSRLAKELVNAYGYTVLWRGTSASLARSIPGIGLYYTTLNVIQSKYSVVKEKPDSAQQAFCIGMLSRSIVSLVLLPVTVVKVRYESVHYNYTSFTKALIEAYTKTGWVGITPTIFRDSLYSGTYYMCYTKFKSYRDTQAYNKDDWLKHGEHFIIGIVSGFIASIITNPLDVIKTRIQVDDTVQNSVIRKRTFQNISSEPLRLFDGIGPRTLRRTLISATTWTAYELFMEKLSR